MERGLSRPGTQLGSLYLEGSCGVENHKFKVSLVSMGGVAFLKTVSEFLLKVTRML